MGCACRLLAFVRFRLENWMIFSPATQEMGTVLSLSLLLADNDDRHPLRHLVTGHPVFIIRIFEIKRNGMSKPTGKAKHKEAE